MPEKSITIDGTGYNADSLLLFAFGTFEKLGWNVKYAGQNLLVAHTISKWNFVGEEITVTTVEGSLTVTSKMVQGQIADLAGKNKKHLQAFATAYSEIRAAFSDELMTGWRQKLDLLTEKTAELSADQGRQTEEVDAIMNISGGNRYLTYILIGINVLVFALMVADGVSFIDPTGQDMVDWGASYRPFVYGGEWWRILTCVFVHIGIIHLLFNMYALYMIGNYLEPMLGKPRFIISYLCSGVFASLVSVWWHDPPVASAGASGAIFGMYGLFLALLSTNLIPKQARNQMLQSIGIFVGYNLLYGMKAGVDNAAHIGGLISGMMIGYVFYFDLRNRKSRTAFGMKPILVAAVTVVFVFVYLKNNSTGTMIKDQESFSRTMEHFAALEELALEAMQSGDTTTKDVYLERLKKTALTDWVHCVDLFEESKTLKLDPKLGSIRETMLQYSNHRVQQTLLYIRAVEEDSDRYTPGIDSIQREIDLIFQKLENMKNESAGE